jgi:hypothetical protein
MRRSGSNSITSLCIVYGRKNVSGRPFAERDASVAGAFERDAGVALTCHHPARRRPRIGG